MPPQTPSTAASTGECFRPVSKSGKLAAEGPSSTASSPTAAGRGGLSPQSRGGRLLASPTEEGDDDEAQSRTFTKPVQSQDQKGKDLAVGEKINEMFKNPASRRDPESLNIFWQEVKKRLLRKHGTINSAFKYMDTSGDGSLTFLEFNAVLRQLLLPLDQRVSRAIFEQATGGDHSLSLEELKGTLMAQTIKRLCVLMERFNTKQRHIRGHVGWFLQNLVHADLSTKLGACARFSKKLTLEFCRSFWRAAMGNKDKKSTRSGGHPRAKELDCATFVRLCVDEADKASFQVYDEGFLMKIYQRVDRAGRGMVSTLDLVTTLTLLSADGDKLEQLRLLFDVFDSDYDGCLLYDQILTMCCTICVQRPVAEHVDTASFDACVTFQDELGLQEGRRLFEAVFWHLSRHTHVEGGIVSWAELSHVFETRPDLLKTLMPGSFSLDWTVPEGVEHTDDPTSRRASATPASAGAAAATATFGLNRAMSPDKKTPNSTATNFRSQGNTDSKSATATTMRSTQATFGRRGSRSGGGNLGFNPGSSNGFAEGSYMDSERFRQETVSKFRGNLRKAAALHRSAHGSDGSRPMTGMQTPSLPSSPTSRGVGVPDMSSGAFSSPQGWMEREKASMHRWAQESVANSTGAARAIQKDAPGQEKASSLSHTASAPSLGRVSSHTLSRPSSQAGMHPRSQSVAGNGGLIPAARLDVPRGQPSIQMEAEDIIRQAERRSHTAVDLRYEAERVSERVSECIQMRSSQGMKGVSPSSKNMFNSRWGSEDHHGWSTSESSRKPANGLNGKLILPPGIRDHVEHRTATRWGGEASDRFRIFASVVAQSRHDGGASAEKLRWGGVGIDYRCDLCCEKHEFSIG